MILITYFLRAASLNFCIIFSAAQQSSHDDLCLTPDHLSGTCINMKSCPILKDLLHKESKNETVAKFLRSSQCGNENHYPKVCCPLNYRIHDSTSSHMPPFTPEPSFVTPRSTTPSKPPSVTPRQFSDLTTNQPLSSTRVRGTSNCGKSFGVLDNLYVFGATAAPHSRDRPWMVALGYRNKTNPRLQFKCGGSLISNEWVVTAAHCITSLPSFNMTTARVGDVVLRGRSNELATPLHIPIDRFILHPNHTTNPFTNDIALVHLQNPVEFNDNINPICLPNETEHRNDSFYAEIRQFKVAGWGKTERNTTSNTLLETRVDFVSTTDCANRYKKRAHAVIDERSLCAGKPNSDSCQGDSGGPLYATYLYGNDPNTYYVFGIVSFGLNCADPDAPGVYTRVAYYYDWITSIVRF